MNTKLIALAFVIIIAVGVTAYYSLNQVLNSTIPTPSPQPTPPPIPSTPTDQNSSATTWGDLRVTYPTELTIVSPQNQTTQTDNLTVRVNVTTGFWAISSVYYKADWLGEYHRLYSLNRQLGDQLSPGIALTANFTGVPEGNHTIEVVANYHDGSHAYGAVNFNVK